MKNRMLVDVIMKAILGMVAITIIVGCTQKDPDKGGNNKEISSVVEDSKANDLESESMVSKNSKETSVEESLDEDDKVEIEKLDKKEGGE